MDWHFEVLDQLEQRRLQYGRLYSTPRGTGPVLLLVHGGYHGAWCWSLYLQFFSESRVPVAAVDLRGHSGQLQDDLFLRSGAREMAEDVTEAASVLDGDVVLAGHSVGALISMVAAERVGPRGLILLAPSPPANIPGMRMLDAVPTGKPHDPPPPERACDWLIPGFTGNAGPVISRLCAESPALLNDRFRMRVGTDPSWVKGPVLCVAAENDHGELHPPGQDEAIAKYYGAAFHMLPAVGHGFMLDPSWSMSAGLVLGWLRRNGLAGSF